MDEILKPESLILFLMFTVPGLVALYVRAQFLTGRLPPIAEGLAGYVTLSLVYHALAYPIAAPLYARPLVSGWWSLAWFGLLFVGPVLLGLLLGLGIRKGWTQALLRRVGLHTVHPADSAWDWLCSSAQACWVLAVLKDGTKWAGYFGPGSFISTDPAERDIFIEKVYEIRKVGQPWIPRASSVWIAHGELQSLEFWPLQLEGEENVAD